MEKGLWPLAQECISRDYRSESLKWSHSDFVEVKMEGGHGLNSESLKDLR